ncbi:hypothetical protein BRC82_03230 [Halobacteriales archaeon QS_1_67_19]|nr:MAG: hypothetical protein BRC82_03230 [Halobacteriales archaeon QS_1_67_19]
MAVPLKLALGVVLLAWGIADYLFPETVLRMQSQVMNRPSEPDASLTRYKRRVGLLCLVAGLVAVIAALE